MSKHIRTMNSFFADETGTDVVEYVMGAAVFGAGAVVTLKATSPTFSDSLNSIASFVTAHL